MPKSVFMPAVSLAVCRKPALADIFRGIVLALPPVEILAVGLRA
ncbi:hypothetical protein C8J30_10137 [Rhodobacter viridis]|uniref:Uncharacterized protein n=1 Tax=Rhodobacter viridis TaxID=1054202 RepID=A0A318U202_9RHOB|nr:hypothetical protein [Rhodobacter viridis]PYF12657.1 hypothetical protein C8J30_10137 [Rhodobacter viridis]